MFGWQLDQPLAPSYLCCGPPAFKRRTTARGTIQVFMSFVSSRRRKNCPCFETEVMASDWHLAPPAFVFFVFWSFFIVRAPATRCPLITPASDFAPAIQFSYSSPVTTKATSALLESTISSVTDEDSVSLQYAVSVVLGNRTVLTSGLATTPFVIGSITKVFTALGALILREKGLLSLDDPVKKFLPDFSIINPYKSHDITLRELMGHLSGMPRELCVNYASEACPVDESKVLEAVSKMQLVRPPWSPSYSNLGFAVLGHAWEKATSPSKSWEEFIMEDIVEPLGLNATGVDLTNVTLASNNSADFDIGWIRPAGQMYSTATDLAKVLIFLLKGSPPLISEASIREWTQSTTIFPDRRSGFALPWELQLVKTANEFVISKDGSLGGFASYIAFHPPTELGVSVLYFLNGSTVHGPRALASQLLNILIPVVETSNQKIIDANYAGMYVCNPTAPISSPTLNRKVAVLGGQINVTGSPSLGIAAFINMSLLLDGESSWIRNVIPSPLLLKNATENSFWIGLLGDPNCLAFFGLISASPSRATPNRPGSVYTYEMVFDFETSLKTIKWPAIGAECVKQVHFVRDEPGDNNL